MMIIFVAMIIGIMSSIASIGYLYARVEEVEVGVNSFRAFRIEREDRMRR